MTVDTVRAAGMLCRCPCLPQRLVGHELPNGLDVAAGVREADGIALGAIRDPSRADVYTLTPFGRDEIGSIRDC